MYRNYWLFILLFVAKFAFGQANIDSENNVHFKQTIKKSDRQSIKILSNITNGKILISKGSNNLADIDFSYQKNKWNPTIAYFEDHDFGNLNIKANNIGFPDKINDSNQCEILLDPTLHYSLGILVGAGIAQLDFQDMYIEKALFRLGVGTFNINLKNTSIPLLKIEAGMGEAIIDLSGKWTNNLNAQIKAGIGNITFIVPKNVGVRFNITGILGEIDADNFVKKEKVYTNSIFTQSKVILDFSVIGAIGNLTIIEK